MSITSPRKPPDSTEIPSSPISRSPQFPLPQYDKAQRRGTAGRYQPRRTSTASITSTIGEVLDAAAFGGTGPLSDLTQNAISTLLTVPITRTGNIPHSAVTASSAYRSPSVKDIPPVTLTNIPHVDPSAFRPYLSQVGPLYESYQRSKAASDEEFARTPGVEQDDGKNEDSDAHLVRSSRADSTSSATAHSRTSSAVSFPTAPFPSISARPPVSKRTTHDLTPLDTIPSVYFDENFQLENPRIFDVVSEFSEVVPPPLNGPHKETKHANGSVKGPTIGRKILHTNALLQEKLSWYMDTVEVHLISSVATASSSFFAVLGSLKDLQAEAADSMAEIRKLRSVLKKVDTEMVAGGLEIMKLQRRQQNIRKLEQAVTQIGAAVEEAGLCETLVGNGDLEGGEYRIAELEQLMAGRPTVSHSEVDTFHCIDLRKVKALTGITDTLRQLRLRIARGYESRFVQALLEDLRGHIEHVPIDETMRRWARSSLRLRNDHQRAQSDLPAYLKLNSHLKSALLSALAGLSKTDGTAHAATAYREAVMREIKSLIRKHLPSSSEDDVESVTSASTKGGRRLTQQEKSAILARNLRALDAEAAEELLVKVYTAVGEALRRLGVQVKVLLDVTSSMEQPLKSTSLSVPQTLPKAESSETGKNASPRDLDDQIKQIRDDVTQALDLSSLLGQAVDVVQTQVVKVLRVRAEQYTHLPLPQFLRYFVLNRLFADECEAVSSRSGDALKDVVNYQVKDFLQNFAEMERKHVTQVLEEDRWEAKDLETSNSELLGRILQSMNSTPKAWTAYTELWHSSTAEISTANNNNTSLTNGLSEKSTSTSLQASTSQKNPALIDSQTYILTQSSLQLLAGVDHYLNLIAAIPSLSSEAASKLLDYLKSFNSRCCQLVLGAGATKSAGLKNITTKHLALASQACSFVVALIPYIREFVRRQAPSTTSAVLQEFDKTKRLFQEHQASIHDKLVEIMSQRSHAHASMMRKIDWDGEVTSELEVNAYAEALVKETGVLHKVLSRHVSELDLKMIMIPIFAQYREEWTKAYRESNVQTEGGKSKMLRDVEFLDNKLNKMAEGSSFGAELISLVQGKQVKPATAAVTPPEEASSNTPEAKPASDIIPTARSSIESMGTGKTSAEASEKKA